MKILITGNMGYIGPSVEKQLLKNNPQAEIIGLDLGYFAHCLTNSDILPETRIKTQFFADIRSVPDEIFENVNVVIHLAAISNDPMGNLFEKATFEINAKATKRIARAAKKAGVKNFVYASSCSMYGSAGDTARTEEDKLNPLTAYANSKVYSEQAINQLSTDNFIVTSLRFSTACGMSERLRLDLVLNDFVASAIVNKKITILSDGSPWRPLITVTDMAHAIEWAAFRTADNGGTYTAINVGSDSWNYQIKDLAEAVSEVLGNIKISIDSNAAPDKRSYRVDFSKFKELAPNHQPSSTLENTIKELHDGLMVMNFREKKFRETWYMRLKVLNDHLESGRLDKRLTWIR